MSDRTESGGSGNGFSRREMNALLAGAAIAGWTAIPALGGQPRRGNQPATPAKPGDPNAPPAALAPPKSFLDGVITADRTRDWILKPFVHVRSYQEDPANVPKDRTMRIEKLSFKTAAVVFPVIRGTASSKTEIDGVKSELQFGDKPVDLTPQYNEAYHSGARLGRWEMTDKEGRECELSLEIPMSCWQTVFDEKAASKAVWPGDGKWGKIGSSTLQPQAMIDIGRDGSPNDALALKDLVAAWTGGKPPQSVPPLQLAKLFAGKVQETFQKSGNGEDYNDFGAFTGLQLQGPAETIRRGTGSPHDIVAVLVGAYRAAGLPARLIIGYDQSDRKGDNKDVIKKPKGGIGGVSLRSWVEFCLFDQANQRECWVPVDVVRMRSRSSRPGKLDDPWKYFGSHDELDVVLPFAHHYIPPTTVLSYGYAFWGWFTTPTSQIAEHYVRMTAQTAPKRAVPKDAPKKKSG